MPWKYSIHAFFNVCHVFVLLQGTITVRSTASSVMQTPAAPTTKNPLTVLVWKGLLEMVHFVKVSSASQFTYISFKLKFFENITEICRV